MSVDDAESAGGNPNSDVRSSISAKDLPSNDEPAIGLSMQPATKSTATGGINRSGSFGSSSIFGKPFSGFSSFARPEFKGFGSVTSAGDQAVGRHLGAE